MDKQSNEYLKMIHNLSRQVVERDKLLAGYEAQLVEANELIVFEQNKNAKYRKQLRNRKRFELILIGTIGALTGVLLLGT